MKYNIELSKEQMIVIAQSLEDISRFASGQWEMRYTIEESGFAIQFIQNPSEEVQLEAVKQTGFAIKCIKNPSEEVQ